MSHIPQLRKLTSVAIRAELLFFQKVTWTIQSDGSFRCKTAWSKAPPPLDGWTVRTMFFAMKADDKAALEFLNEVHVFSSMSSTNDPIPRHTPELLQFRELLVSLAVSNPTTWKTVLSKHPKRLTALLNMNRFPNLTLDWSGSSPCAVLTSPNALRAIFATIQIDHWSRARLRRCVKPDCWKVFQADDPRKVYCSHECAHHQAVRRYRQRQRQEANAGLESCSFSRPQSPRGF
jgi:hypothetical protein